MVRDTLSSQGACTHQPRIPTTNNERYAPDTNTLKTRSGFMVKVTWKLYVTLHHPKLHSHTKFGIPTSKNKGYMHRTRSLMDGWMLLHVGLHFFPFIWYSTWPLSEKKNIFDPSPGVESECKDRLFAFIVFYAPVPLIWYLTWLLFICLIWCLTSQTTTI